MVVLDAFFWISGGLLLAVMFYLWFLAVVSLLPERKHARPHEPLTKFAILIPAHNEATIIENTLKSIEGLDYPTELFDTVVVADNCTDKTAEVSKGYATQLLEREDENKTGKGFALQWTFEELRKRALFDSYSAFVVIDADTILDRRFLGAMDRRLQSGKRVIQGSNEVMNPDASVMASLYYLGFALSRYLKYLGRSKLDWSANLLGNGMCLHREVIERFEWRATSIVEDLEYTALLNLNGIRVYFVPEARNFSIVAETFNAGKIQRSRWDIGKFHIFRRYFLPLLRRTLRKGDLACLSVAVELIIPPFSLFAVLSLGLFFLFLVSAYDGLDSLARMWLTAMLALCAYVLLGLIVARANWKIYKNLVYVPFYLMWRIWSVIWGYFAKVSKRWEKTTRKNIL